MNGMASFIAVAEFDALFNEKAMKSTMQWKELPVNVIYKINQIKEVLVDSTATMILDLIDEQGHVLRAWAPQRLYKDLLRFPDKANIYVRSLGKKECKMAPGRWYHDYNLAQLSR